jgi:hypothetical protein
MGGAVSIGFSPYVGIPVSGFALYGNGFKAMYYGNQQAPLNDLIRATITGEAGCDD